MDAMCKTILDWRQARNLTQAEAAALVDVKQAAWSKWENGQVPPEQCLSVHKVTGIALHLLRPDIYPTPPLRRSTDRRKREGAQA
jgi:transcriptional regulator with XRE-family HTH domain